MGPTFDNPHRHPRLLGRAARLALAGLVVFVSGTAVAEEPVPVFRCQLNLRLPGGGSEDVRAFKSFRHDGTVNAMFVEMSDLAGSLVRMRQRGERSIVTMRWPGDHRLRDEAAPFDWASGSIRISYPGHTNAARPRTGEVWRQVVVDRDRSALVHESDGGRILFLSGLQLHLASELGPLSDPGDLRTGLEALLAWGRGANSVTVFETLVRRARPENGNSQSPAGRRRIVAEYELDMAALAGTVGRVRAAVSDWETQMESRWRQCEPMIEGGDIIVTTARQEAGAYAS